MGTREKVLHWLANQRQVIALVGVRKWLKGQLAGILIGALLVLLPVLALAQTPNTARLSWTVPTASTDGGALTKCATQTSTGTCLRSFRVYRGASQAEVQAKTDGRAINDRNATSYDWTGLTAGTHYFATTALNGDGVESGLSGIGSRVVPPVAPLPPGNFTVQQDTTAFYVIQQENRFVLLPAGTVNAGTTCDASQQVNGHSVVPRSAVQWFGNVRPLAVVALCS